VGEADGPTCSNEAGGIHPALRSEEIERAQLVVGSPSFPVRTFGVQLLEPFWCGWRRFPRCRCFAHAV